MVERTGRMRTSAVARWFLGHSERFIQPEPVELGINQLIFIWWFSQSTSIARIKITACHSAPKWHKKDPKSKYHQLPYTLNHYFSFLQPGFHMLGNKDNQNLGCFPTAPVALKVVKTGRVPFLQVTDFCDRQWSFSTTIWWGRHQTSMIDKLTNQNALSTVQVQSDDKLDTSCNMGNI